MLRGQKIKRRNRKRLGVLCVMCLAILIVGFSAWYLVQASAQGLDSRNCPSPRPAAIDFLIVDGTDRVGDVTKADLIEKLRAFLDDDVAVGEGVQVWPVSGEAGAKHADTPLLCKPPRSNSELTANLDLENERFEREYRDPLLAAVDAVLDESSERTSPILETMVSALVSLPAPMRKLPVRFVVASDLAQHARFSLENGTADFESLRRSPEYAALDPGDLRGVRVVVHQILRRRHYGRTAAFVAFWRALVESHNGSFAIQPLRGVSQ